MAEPIAKDRLLVTLTVGELERLIDERVAGVLGEPRSPAPAQPPPRYVDPAAIARHFGVSRATVHNWVHREGCPHEQRGKLVRFELAAVEAWFRGRAPGLRRVK